MLLKIKKKKIAKILQNLSNGVLFKDKEMYMLPLNKFLKKHMETLANYFDALVDVEDLGDALDVKKKKLKIIIIIIIKINLNTGCVPNSVAVQI